ncbi:methyl-accepting chemotaxis protein [Parasulfuritortus cantonensis]|uniref:Methyl-accepting chemotaxis protein n=1 Tax=Parasulfuritortus cantonensis TaxID=2528202 RepID=A0A4R1B7S8_9PROT|nr:methyl-accepting chemotaxis protein [Parasulfuritortus cantonensis]TCJ11809.1 methyl-accepting chemotaxis protein [Parasulfuritortus cantonensis]
MDKKRSLSLKTRLFLQQVGMLAGLLMLGLYSLAELHQHMMEERHAALRALVDVGIGVVREQYEQMQAGVIDRAEAERRAKANLRKIRFGDNDYFFIYDLDGRNVMHGSKPEREGTSQIDATDANGKPYIRHWLAVLKERGEGEMEYMFPKPGSNEPLSKASYAKVFAPWGWWVGTGVYIDDVEATFRDNAVGTVVFVAGAALLLALLGWFINRSVQAELGGEPAEASGRVERFAEGDLTQPITSSSRRPGNLLGALAAMQDRLNATVRAIREGTEVLARESGDLSVAAGEISLAARNQAESSAATAASIEQLTVSINEVSEIARQTEDNSSQTATLADHGRDVVRQAAAEIEHIAESVRDSAERIQSLVGRSQEIGNITNVIKDIADQTNLLALNAAIEAARAGEQGRGFAVVADEVRKLAERTTQATAEISRMIEAIQEDTHDAVQAMEGATPKVRRGQELAQQATGLLDQIQRQAGDSLARARDVATASREQAATANGIAGHVENIASMTEQTNAATQSNAEAADQLKELAGRLQKSVAYFKV